jgi:hypothetical protein
MLMLVCGARKKLVIFVDFMNYSIYLRKRCSEGKHIVEEG